MTKNMSKIQDLVQRIHNDEAGAGGLAIEKIILIAIIALPLILIVYYIKEVVINYLNSADGVMGNHSSKFAPPASNPYLK